MKNEITNSQLQRNSYKIARIGYCGAQYLLHGLNAYAYNAGGYGWNWDAFDIGGGVTVCTGYRNLTGASVKYDDLEQRAEKIVLEGFKMPYDEQQKQFDALRVEFIRRVYNATAEYYKTGNGLKLLTTWGGVESVYTANEETALNGLRRLYSDLEIQHDDPRKSYAYTSSGAFAALWFPNTTARKRDTNLYLKGIAINTDGEPVAFYQTTDGKDVFEVIK